MVQTPKEMYCRACPGSKELQGSSGSGRIHKTTYYKPADLEPRDIAVRILKVCTGKPRGARRLASRAGIEFGPVVQTIIDRLGAAGKLEAVKVEGKTKWRKV
jgi:hypothetical protein